MCIYIKWFKIYIRISACKISEKMRLFYNNIIFENKLLSIFFLIFIIFIMKLKYTRIFIFRSKYKLFRIIILCISQVTSCLPLIVNCYPSTYFKQLWIKLYIICICKVPIYLKPWKPFASFAAWTLQGGE